MNKPNMIFVIGFMGSGKSTFGKRIAKELGYQFVDSDREIERQEGMTISQIFSTKGERYFRKLEMNFLKDIDRFKQNTIMSTGGGMPCNQYRLNRLLNLGSVICLEIDAKSAINRLKDSKISRPLVNNLSNEKLNKKISLLLTKRTKYYEQADIIIPALNAKKIKGKQLLKLIGS